MSAPTKTTWNPAGSLPQHIAEQGKCHPLHDDVYLWCAVYRDGSVLLEVTGEELHHFREVDQDQLAAFILQPVITGISQHSVKLTAGDRLLFKRQRRVKLDLMDDGSIREGKRETWHILGYQKKDGTQSVLYISATGDAVLADNDKEIL